MLFISPSLFVPALRTSSIGSGLRRPRLRTSCLRRRRFTKTACWTTSADPKSMYIHLPFCAQRCAYCAFTVIVSGRSSLPSSKCSDDVSEKNTIDPIHMNYIEILCHEIDSFFNLRRRWSTNEKQQQQQQPLIRTLYFGGGTPSLLDPLLFFRLITKLKEHVIFDENIEITCEMDPATFTSWKVKEFASMGINRASIGAQSFDDKLLLNCGRIHKSDDIYNAVEVVRHAGIENISLDLISALPYQTLKSWRHSIDAVISLKPQHVSIYDLTLEAGTPFEKKYRQGITPLPSEDHAIDMLCDGSEQLKRAGYERYEISNFALDNTSCSNRSRHNLAYWKNHSFFAFGIGATSVVDNIRFKRPDKMGLYTQYVDHLYQINNQNNVVTKTEDMYNILFPGSKQMSHIEQFEDFIINGMRLIHDGICVRDVSLRIGSEFETKLINAVEKCNHFENDGLMVVSRTDDGTIERIRLTEKGALIENSIVSELLLESVWRSPPINKKMQPHQHQ